MAEEDLDALVVRAPDNVLYLTNFWGMKGYDAAVFPREGPPVLITIEPSAEDAADTAWTTAVALVPGYDPDDPRPPLARTLDTVLEAAKPYEKVGLELSLGTQASDRMVGEPTTFTKAWFDAFPSAVDATPLLARARAVKTPQEIERMRLANEIAAAAMEHVAKELRPGMKESEAAALWQGFVHGQGTGWKGRVGLALGFSLAFLRFWGFEAPGKWTLRSVISTGILVLAMALQIFALFRSLQPEDDEVREYRKTVAWFIASAVALVLGLLVAVVEFSGVMAS
jgi:hypothetical protein